MLFGTFSFVPTLFFYLVGEEGSYVTSSFEMMHLHKWFQLLIYGLDFGRPPLMNWLIIPVANLIGWQHAVIAIRLVSATATLGTIIWLYWLSLKLFSDKSFALFAALTGLSLADWLLYRGWLSYSDPVFAFFTFGAMATLWVACIERNRGSLLLSVLLVSCGMFTKTFTAYIFYGTIAFILLWQRQARLFILSPRSIFVFSLALVIPLAWFSTIPHGGSSTAMWGEIMRKFTSQNFNDYFLYLVAFPIEVIVRLSPALLLAIYLLLRRRVLDIENASGYFLTALWTVGLGFLPYWLAPYSNVRYLLPLYPMIALISARIIWRAGESGRKLALRWFTGIIIFKFIFVLFLFPFYQAYYRGENYAQTAQIIIKRTQGFPLYVTDSRSIGLSIVGYIDMMRYPQPPLLFPPNDFGSGYVLSMEVDKELGELSEAYTVAADQIFLLCRGAACDAKSQTSK